MNSSLLRSWASRSQRPLPRRCSLYEAVEPHMGTLFRIKLYRATMSAGAAGVSSRL